MTKEIKLIQGETSAALRQQYLDLRLKPEAEDIFRRDADVMSVMLVVSQYWADEASDAVHLETLLFDTAEPKFPADVRSSPFMALEEDIFVDLSERGSRACAKDGDYSSWPSYPDLDCNTTAITAFAAACEELGCQEESLLDNATPYALAVRQPDGTARVEIIGKIHRPEWDDRFDVGFDMEDESVTIARIDGDWTKQPAQPEPRAADAAEAKRPSLWKRLFGGG